jgi:alkylation response protein AidB-like acyl-CoA dehydrogenase
LESRADSAIDFISADLGIFAVNIKNGRPVLTLADFVRTPLTYPILLFVATASAMVNFNLSPEQKTLRSNVQAFAQNVLSTAPKLYSHLPTQTARFQATLPIYQAAVSAGLIKGQVPIPLGGGASSLIDAAIVVEEFYAVEPSAAITILGTGLGLTPLILSGSKEQHEIFLKPFLAQEGEALASFAHSEPAGTANWLEKGAPGLQTTAYEDGDEWVVDGEKVCMLDPTHSKLQS